MRVWLVRSRRTPIYIVATTGRTYLPVVGSDLVVSRAVCPPYRGCPSSRLACPVFFAVLFPCWLATQSVDDGLNRVMVSGRMEVLYARDSCVYVIWNVTLCGGVRLQKVPFEANFHF